MSNVERQAIPDIHMRKAIEGILRQCSEQTIPGTIMELVASLLENTPIEYTQYDKLQQSVLVAVDEWVAAGRPSVTIDTRGRWDRFLDWFVEHAPNFTGVGH